jgi:hypothetical protein
LQIVPVAYLSVYSVLRQLRQPNTWKFMHCLYRQYRRIIALLLIVLHAGFVVIVDQINIPLIINGLVIEKMYSICLTD